MTTNEKSTVELPESRESDPAKAGSRSLGTTKIEQMGENQNQASNDLRTVIQESKERLASESQVPPRKRGRPRKQRPDDGKANASGASPSSQGLSQPTGVGSTSYGPFLRPLIELPFNIAAKRTGFDEFKLESDVSQGLAEQVDACLKLYFPQVSDRTAILISTLASFSVVTYSKYMLYQEWSEKQKKPEHENNSQKEDWVISKPHVDAADYFPSQSQ